MAATIFTLVVLGVYSCLIKAYQLEALSRCRDDARAVLRTYADQFERLQTTELVGASTYNRWLFNPTSGPSGRGMVWGSLSDSNTSVAAADVPYLTVTLGSPDSGVTAQVTRDVSYVNSSTGATSSSRTIEASGYMLKGVFAISYSLAGHTYSQSITVLRAAP